MESTQLVLNAISTVGFPIVVCLIMIWMVYKQAQGNQSEQKALRDVIENNTTSITKLYEKIDALIDSIGRS